MYERGPRRGAHPAAGSRQTVWFGPDAPASAVRSLVKLIARMMGLFLYSRRNWAERGRRARYRSGRNHLKIRVLREKVELTCVDGGGVEVEVERKGGWANATIARSRDHVWVLALGPRLLLADWLSRDEHNFPTNPKLFHKLRRRMALYHTSLRFGHVNKVVR